MASRSPTEPRFFAAPAGQAAFEAAKRPDARARRLGQLIDASAQGLRMDAMTPLPRKP